MPSREEIYQALFGLVTPLIAVDDAYRTENPYHLQMADDAVTTDEQPFRTISREVIEVQRIEPGNQPVLMMYEMDDLFQERGEHLTKTVFTVVFIFGATSNKGIDPPGQVQLNPLIDAVIASLVPPLNAPRQTLGDLVHDVRVSGNAGKDHGNNSTKTDNRQASYYLPVKITLQP